jgi:hypothetical protein
LADGSYLVFKVLVGWRVQKIEAVMALGGLARR